MPLEEGPLLMDTIRAQSSSSSSPFDCQLHLTRLINTQATTSLSKLRGISLTLSQNIINIITITTADRHLQATQGVASIEDLLDQQ